MSEQKFSKIVEKDLTGNKLYVTVFTYTETGKLKEKTCRYESGEIWYSKKYEYNSKDKLVTEEHYRNEYPGDELKSTYSRFEYKYDQKGNSIDEIERSREGILLSRALNEYYENGNMKQSRRTRYNKSGKTLNINYIEFNEAGKITFKKSYLPTGAVSNIFKYEYDSEGILRNKICIKPSGNVSQKFTYEYQNGILKSEKEIINNELTGQKDFNENELPVREMIKNKNGIILVTEYEYFPNGKIKGKRSYKNYELIQKETYKYDGDFKITEKTTLELQNGSSSSEIYKYFDWGYTVNYVMRSGEKEYRKRYEYHIQC
jgi:antitoxin component YwqK of YwqJK toxin-antitoxin module